MHLNKNSLGLDLQYDFIACKIDKSGFFQSESEESSIGRKNNHLHHYPLQLQRDNDVNRPLHFKISFQG